MSDFDTIDYFTDQSLVPDPHPYFDHLRSKCPVVREPHYGVLAITGYEEAATVLQRSRFVLVVHRGRRPVPPLPFTPKVYDITEQIDGARSPMPMFEHMVAMDPPSHQRALPAQQAADAAAASRRTRTSCGGWSTKCLDDFIANGSVSSYAYAKPFSLLVITDLLGVPQDRPRGVPRRARVDRPGRGGRIAASSIVGLNPLK